GKWWKEQTGLPLPLGGNVVRKDIPAAVRSDLSEIIRESIDYGLAHRGEAVRHSLPYARDMDATLAGKFIGMYVNHFTRDYGEVGRDAIRKFLAEAHNKGTSTPRSNWNSSNKSMDRTQVRASFVIRHSCFIVSRQNVPTDLDRCQASRPA